ncbi:MAG: hypothetical protein P1U64_07870 [Alcanivoracaceae bacterium]|nr:hypothetical protein [Alcanivoracaceae bacterium]
MMASLESLVNLNGYSTSNGFIGFVESITDSRLADSRQIIGLLTDWIYSDAHTFSIATSLHFPKSRRLLETFYGAENIDYQELLVFEEHGLVFSVEADGIFEELQVGEADPSELWCRSFSHLKVSQFERCIIERLLFAKMNMGGLDGHLFIGSIDHGMVLYPHGEVGFGFILMTDSSAHHRLDNFIQEAVSGGNFRFVSAASIPGLH